MGPVTSATNSGTIPARVREVAAMAAAALRAELGEEAQVLWFGSWPRGDAQPRSDIDLAVSREPAISPRELARARQRLAELPTLYGVDVLSLEEAGEALRREIHRDGIPL